MRVSGIQSGRPGLPRLLGPSRVFLPVSVVDVTPRILPEKDESVSEDVVETRGPQSTEKKN